MKKILAFIMCFISVSCFAFAKPTQVNLLTLGSCPQAVATTDAGFCPSFQSVAQCQCVSRGLPPGMCKDMSLLYDRMIAMFGSVDKACQYQADTSHDTTKQQCIDDWNCYRSGGTDSQGGACSSTGKSCR
jgi:hypothetical protein